MADRPAVRGKRFLKLAGMTASVMGDYAKTKLRGVFLSDDAAARDLRRSYRDSGGRIARTLGELKGAVMKLGQMASIASEVLPTELAEALRGLQREAPPMPYGIIADQVEAELGLPPERLFAHFDPQPFAAASIGQVHRATMDDGREVVCKVQYPGIDSAVDSDLYHFKLALRASGLARISRRALNEAFSELRIRLYEELDYCREADNLRLLRDFHIPRHPFVRIPEVVGERSAQRVLTLTCEMGDPLHRLDALGYTQSERDHLGINLFTLLGSQLFELGAIHADPHPGNFAFGRDGALVVYDFGCIKRVPVRTLEAYRDVVLFGLDDDYEGVEDALVRLRVRNLAGPPVESGYYKGWRDLLVKRFVTDAPYDFGKSTGLRQAVTKQIPGVVRRMPSFRPPTDLILVNRTVAGHYGNLRALRARVPVIQMLRRFLDRFDPDSLGAAAPA